MTLDRLYTSDYLQYDGPQAYAGMNRHTTLMLPGGLRGWTSSRKHEIVQATQQVTVHIECVLSLLCRLSHVLAIAHTGYGQYMLRFISVIGGFPMTLLVYWPLLIIPGSCVQSDHMFRVMSL